MTGSAYEAGQTDATGSASASCNIGPGRWAAFCKSARRTALARSCPVPCPGAVAMTRKNAEAVPAKAKVLIVDDHPVVREGLVMHFAAQPDLEVCGEAEDLPGALTLLASTRPDVAIIDISLQNSNGIELIRRIKDREDAVRILVWSMYPESLYAERALRAGAEGYLNKGQATHCVLDAVRAILQGSVYVSGVLAEQLLKR